MSICLPDAAEVALDRAYELITTGRVDQRGCDRSTDTPCLICALDNGAGHNEAAFTEARIRVILTAGLRHLFAFTEGGGATWALAAQLVAYATYWRNLRAES